MTVPDSLVGAVIITGYRFSVNDEGRTQDYNGADPASFSVGKDLFSICDCHHCQLAAAASGAADYDADAGEHAAGSS